MTERIDTEVTITVPLALATALASLTVDYVRMHAGEPSVVAGLLHQGILEHGMRVMREAHDREANRRFGERMGWSNEQEEMGT